MKYYCTERPPMPGAIPKRGLLEIREYDRRTFVPDIGREAWAELIYGRELTEEEVFEYELAPAPAM